MWQNIGIQKVAFMTEERMKYFFQDSKGQTCEEFKDNMLEPDESYEECYRKISRVLINYGTHEMTPWEYFKEVYQDIPRVHRVPLILETIYIGYNFDLYEMIEMINEYLLSETEDERECRLKRNKEMLKGKVKKNKIKLYRGVAENYLLPTYAISFTLDKEVAEHFLKYHSSIHGRRFGFIYEMEIPIDYEGILFCSNEREEQEVFYWAVDVSDIPAFMYMGNEEGMYLTEETIEEYEDYYDIIWFSK